MLDSALDQLYLPQRRNVRLDTLLRLRWLAIIGQTTAVLVVYYGFEFPLPIWACLAVIALSAWLNVALRIRFTLTQRLEPERAAWLLAFDIAELAVLLFLTGGLQNPFAFLFLSPVLLSATSLPPRITLMLGGFAVLCATVLVFVHYPLPWDPEDPLELPWIYMTGVWFSIVLSTGFISVYAWQLTEGGRQLAEALAATELVLVREQHLSQLDGLAAAAAHELGTPLATIALVARELEREMAGDDRHAEDIALLNSQAQRCRDILAKPTSMSGELDQALARQPLCHLVEEVVEPYRAFGTEIAIAPPRGEGPEPVGRRNPAIIQALANLVENAVDFAESRVEIAMEWDEREVALTVSDDGRGFTPAILARIGEPYVTTRGPAGDDRAHHEAGGLGLGLFIAKTLLERTGARLTFRNLDPPRRGALVRVAWPRPLMDSPAKPEIRA
jgi:two-component system sensor histidine kinase RegB